MGPEYLRFDFSYYQPLTKDQLENIEMAVNEQILRNIATDVKLTSIDEALDQWCDETFILAKNMIMTLEF